MPWPFRRKRLALGALACALVLSPLPVGAASPVSGPLGTQTLSTGDTGPAVRALQLDLSALGDYSGSIDGIYGTATAAAVSAFQAQHHLAASGVASPATEILAVALNEPVLKEGESGPSVAALQRRLKAWGDYVFAVNGTFGATTRTALIWFQEGEGLPATGVADPATWIDILGTPGGQGSTPSPTSGSTPSQGSTATTPPPATANETVLGYWVQRGSSPSDYAANARDITEIGPLWYSVRTDGSVKQWWPSVVPSVVAEVHRNGGKVIALINNMGGSGTVLASASTRLAAVNNLVAIAQANHLDGFNIDFEGITGYSAQGLVAFMSELHSRLAPLGLETTIAVGPRASTNIPAGSLSAAYDYGALAPYVDQMVIMTYDMHGIGTAAGPVSSAPWAAGIVRYALNQGVPAHKILLGIADYGYNWSSQGTTSISDSAALRLAASVGAQVTLDPTSGEDHFTYVSQGVRHQVWFEDARSLPSKIAIVSADHLGGVALWVLGGEDTGYFPTLQKDLGL